MRNELASLALAQEISWKKKLRVLQLEEEGLEYNFFHRVVGKQEERIHFVEVNGVVYEGKEEIEWAIRGFYEQLLEQRCI